MVLRGIPNHPSALTSHNNPTYVYQTAGDLALAIPLFGAALADVERVLHPAHGLARKIRSNSKNTTSKHD